MPSANKIPSASSLSRDKKTAVIALAVFSILVIFLAGWQISAKITKPFKIEGKGALENKTATTTDLHLIDTDHDGLSDYDEINVYHTSPYLEDSDSDGISDKQEILDGTDPNCPTGQVCNAQETPINSSASSATSTILDGSSTDSSASPVSNGEVTPALLRQILLQNGYDQATLDKISDEEIMKSYEEANKNAAANNSSTAIGTSTISQ